MNTEITLLKWPGDEDWMFAKSCALVTIGKHSGKAPDTVWKLTAPYLPIDTDERREAYLLMFGAVKAMSEKEEQHGKAGKADQEQQQTVL